MKIQIDQNTYQEYQQYMEQKLYDQVESCIRNGDLKELKKLSSENKIDFTHDSGFLGILAAGKPEMLRFICEQSANLIIVPHTFSHGARDVRNKLQITY